MTLRHRTAIAAFTVLAGAGVTAYFRGSSAAPTAPRAHAMRCDFADAPELAWRLTVAVDGAPGDASLDAVLRLRAVRAEGEGRWVLAGRLAPRGHGDRVEDLRRGFAVRVASTCRFEDFAWEPGTTAREADTVRAAMRAVEFHLPEAPRPQWSSTHRDDNGSFVAWYRATDQDTAVEATAGDYLPGRGAVAAHQQGWTLRARLDPRGYFATRVDSAARYVVASTTSEPLSVRVSLERIEVPEGSAPAADVDGFAWRSPPRDESPADAPAGASPVAAAPDPFAAMGPDVAYARLVELFDGDADPAHDRAFRHLLAWLRARPEAAAELMALLRAGRGEPRLHALVYMTLGESDAPTARRALIGALSSADTAMDRQRAAAALGAMRTPTVEALDALREAAQARGSTDDAVITRGVAARSLGMMATDRAPGAIADGARATIREAIGSDDPDTRRSGLDAAGNARTVALLGPVSDALASSDASARESAAHALRGLPRESAQPLLTARLREETAPAVRREVAMTLTENARGQFSAEAVDAAARALPTTPDPSVRVELLRLLGEASRATPAARAALIAWTAQEPEVDLLRVIGSYLTVDEMRDALRQRAAR